MKKLILLICVFVMLIAATGAVSAAKPAPDTFTITGTTGFCGFEVLPTGHEQYCFTAEGDVTGYFDGDFTFIERVDYDPATGKVKNEGVVTITTPDGTAIVQFEGEADAASVWGEFEVEKKKGTGAYTKIKGEGDYTGGAAYPGYPFSVTFTGKLKG